MEKTVMMQSAPAPTPTQSTPDDAPIYNLGLTQDEFILLYNVLGVYQSTLLSTMNCVLQTQDSDADDALAGIQNIRRKIFIESGLA